MSVLLYPADLFACGHYRLIWPGEYLAAQGRDVIIERPSERRLELQVDERTRDVAAAILPDGIDVIVFQRPTHKFLAQAVPIIRSAGIAVVVEVDDDLSSVHQGNIAYKQIHPERHKLELIERGWRQKPGMPNLNQMAARLQQTRPYDHSWVWLERACEEATLVTVSSRRLLRRYARHGRGRVLHNYLPDHHYGHPRADHTGICWPASIHSHPNDPQAAGSALARVLRETGVEFTAMGEAEGTGRAFGLPRDPPTASHELLDYPAALATIGIGITPLADTMFNRSKSWLKPLELAGAGVPFVASPRPEYWRLHEMGAGLTAAKPADWHRHLSQLVRSADLRAEISAAGRAVADRLRLSEHADEYWDAWQWAAEHRDALTASAEPVAAASA